MSPSAQRRAAPLAVWGGLSIVILAAQGLDATLPLRWVRAQALDGAWWQGISAQVVHLGWGHAWLNILAMGGLLLALSARLTGWWLLLAGGGGLLGVALVLLADTQCATYAGASGALHGLWAGAAWALCGQGRFTPPDRAAAVLGWAMLIGMGAKLVDQRLDALGGAWSLGAGFAVYLPAHEAGALGGWMAVALAGVGSAARAPGAQQKP